MKKHRAAALLPLVMTSVVLLATGSPLASAAGHRAAGKVQLFEADTALAGNRGTVIVTGAITDHGTDHQGVAGGGTINRIALTKGSFEIDLSKLGAKLVFPTDPETCASTGSATGPVSVVPGSGTRAYRGISGTFTVTATTASIAPRHENGSCDTGASRYPGVLIAKGSGRVSYK